MAKVTRPTVSPETVGQRPKKKSPHEDFAGALVQQIGRSHGHQQTARTASAEGPHSKAAAAASGLVQRSSVLSLEQEGRSRPAALRAPAVRSAAPSVREPLPLPSHTGPSEPRVAAARRSAGAPRPVVIDDQSRVAAGTRHPEGPVPVAPAARSFAATIEPRTGAEARGPAEPHRSSAEARPAERAAAPERRPLPVAGAHSLTAARRPEDTRLGSRPAANNADPRLTESPGPVGPRRPPLDAHRPEGYAPVERSALPAQHRPSERVPPRSAESRTPPAERPVADLGVVVQQATAPLGVEASRSVRLREVAVDRLAPSSTGVHVDPRVSAAQLNFGFARTDAHAGRELPERLSQEAITLGGRGPKPARGAADSLERLREALSLPRALDAAPARPISSSTPLPPAQQISQLILARLPDSGQVKAELTLYPEQLGTVQVNLSVDQSGSVSATVLASPQAIEQLGGSIDQLAQQLVAAGLQVANLDLRQHNESRPEQSAPVRASNATVGDVETADPSLAPASALIVGGELLDHHA